MAKKENGEQSKERKPLPPTNASYVGKGEKTVQCYAGTLTVDLRTHRMPNVQSWPDPLDWCRSWIATLQPIVKELASIEKKDDKGKPDAKATAKARRKAWKALDEIAKAKKAVQSLSGADLATCVVTRVTEHGAEMSTEELAAMVDALQAQLNNRK
jgi:cytochrome P450